MTQEEIINALQDDKTMPFIQPDQLAQIVDFVSENYKPSLSEGLEEAAENRVTENGRFPISEFEKMRIRDIEFGAEWQKNKMLEGAVGGEVCHIASVHYVKTNESQLFARLKQFKSGDKVKIIIVKEDEK